MPELYIFLAAILVMGIIIWRRNILFTSEFKKKFKKRIEKKIEENRELQFEEDLNRFKDSHTKEKEEQKFNIVKYKKELRSADMAIAKSQWNNAKKFLIQTLAFAKDELPVSIKLAKVYMESGDYRKAESLYRRLLEENNENVDIYENLGKIMAKKRKYKEAIQAYARAVELDQKNDQILVALGKLYQLLMRYSLAAECYKRAAELKPREVEYLFLLADSCTKDEDLDNALFTYEKILTVEPYNERAKTGASDIRLKIKEFETFLTHKTFA